MAEKDKLQKTKIVKIDLGNTIMKPSNNLKPNTNTNKDK